MSELMLEFELNSLSIFLLIIVAIMAFALAYGYSCSTNEMNNKGCLLFSLIFSALVTFMIFLFFLNNAFAAVALFVLSVVILFVGIYHLNEK